MKTAFISTLSLTTAPRAAMQRLQADLAQASKEVVTGRMADVGLEIGHQTARSVTLRHDLSGLDALIGSNAVLSSHLGQTDIALGAIGDGANAFLASLISVGDAMHRNEMLEAQGKAALDDFIGLVNVGDGQRFHLGGIASTTKPLADYDGAPKTAVDAAFAARFGLALPDPQDDPSAAAISAADMADFIDNEFAALFDDPAWMTDWSSASDTNATARISSSERVEIPANANDPAMRKLAMAYTMMAGLGADRLGDGALQVVLDKARVIVGEAITDLTATRTALGMVEGRVASASERMQKEQDVIETRLSALEGVDPYEAKVKIDTMSTQLEMSYSLTAKLLRLSIMNYA
jgi:flagellar hook-associated protein 3 FlgL